VKTESISEICRRQGLNRFTAFVLAFLHVGAVAALFMFSWKALAVSVLLYCISIGLGISMGYHRLHTHRSYKVPLWLEYVFATCGTMTLEGGPIFWVATHRMHHQLSDMPGDPHSPRDGAFWSHMGWILWGDSNHKNTRMLSKYAPDLAKHPYYVWLNNWHWVPVTILAAGLLAWGGVQMFCWAICLRIVLGLHITWAVNSATHMFGSRRFNTRDDSRNNWWVAMVSFGEGWHNNHHAHPTSARHGLAWYEFDASWLLIQALKRIGVAKNIKVATVDSRLVEREAA
jgi:stearoyl-CoA desaturase (Delta-9 desaturase)